jgi:hypothetical protein
MYLIRRYHVVNNNYSHSLFPYSHFFFGLFLDESEWLQKRCEWRHFTAQTVLKLGDPRWLAILFLFSTPSPPLLYACFFPFPFSAILGCPRFLRTKRFCWLLLFLLHLFAGELLATSPILYFVLGLRFFKTIFASFAQEEIPIDMGESSSFLSFPWRNLVSPV